MDKPTQLSATRKDVLLGAVEFPLLKEQLDRLSSQGVDTAMPELWHPNALLAAADLMGGEDSNAFQVNSQASMLVALLLTLEEDAAQPVELEVHHTDGAVARLSLGFTRTPDEQDDSLDTDSDLQGSSEGPAEEKPKRLWVERSSIQPESIEALVNAFAKTTDTQPGGYASILGAGALIASIQSLDSMNAASTTVAYEGLGDDNHSFDFVGLKVSIQDSPAPTVAASSPRGLKR